MSAAWKTLIEAPDAAERRRAAQVLRAEAARPGVVLDVDSARRALAAGDEDARKLAVWVIGAFAGGVPLLGEALADPSAAVQLMAIAVLSSHKTDQSLELVARAAAAGDESVAGAAIAAMIAFGGAAVGVLARLARENVSAHVKARALVQLSALAPAGDPAAAAAAMENVSHAEAEVRAAACRLLGTAGGAGARPALLDRLADESSDVRRRAELALRELDARECAGAE